MHDDCTHQTCAAITRAAGVMSDQLIDTESDLHKAIVDVSKAYGVDNPEETQLILSFASVLQHMLDSLDYAILEQVFLNEHRN